MGHFAESEIRDVYEHYADTRVRIDKGELGWDAMASHLTEDAVFVDPAWGRYDGLPTIMKFFEASMTGLEDWTFPLEWMAVDGDYLITGWQNRLPGKRPDGTLYQAPGMSRMHYVGGGKFDYEQDLINMVHMLEVIRESGWKPNPGFSNPPRHVVRLCSWEP